MSGFEQCPSCTWRISHDEEEWGLALAEHRAAHREKTSAAPQCKVDGCSNPSAGKGGWCANLCDEHISVEGRRRQAVRFAKPAPLPVSPPQPDEAKPSSSDRPTPPQPKPKPKPKAAAAPSASVLTLTQLALEVEETDSDLAEARVRHESAVAALRAALDAIA